MTLAEAFSIPLWWLSTLFEEDRGAALLSLVALGLTLMAVHAGHMGFAARPTNE